MMTIAVTSEATIIRDGAGNSGILIVARVPVSNAQFDAPSG